MSTRTLGASAAIGAVLYLGWLGWKDILIPPPLSEEVPAAALAGPTGPQAGEVAGSPTPAGSTTRAAETPAPSSNDGSASVEPDVAASLGSASPSAPGGTRLDRAGPDVARSAEPGARRLPPADGSSADREVEAEADREKDSRKPRARQDIGGSVLDRGGSPVAGLTVQAQARRLFASLEDGTSAFQAPSRAVTDGAGRFSFPQLSDGEYELRTDPTELYESATTMVRAGVDSAVLVVEAKSGRALFVHGVVASARGGPLKGVRVEAVGRSLATVSDDAGGYGLRISGNKRDQDVALRFESNGYRDQRVVIGAREADGAEDVVRDVSLEPAGALAPVSGVVTGSDGPPVPRASVQLLSARVARRYQAVSGNDGRFAFDGVEESDDYRLWVRPAKGYRDHVREGVDVGPQGASLDVVVDSLGLAGLRGSMVDPEGQPVPGFTLWLTSAYGTTARSLAATGDAQGRFELRDLPEGAVTLGTRAAPEITVSGLQLAAGATREARIPLDVGPYRLEVTLLDEHDTPVGGARVSLLGLQSDQGLISRSFRETVSDARGYLVFTQLGSGTPTLSVTAAGFRGVRLQPHIGSMTTPLQIKLSAGP